MLWGWSPYVFRISRKKSEGGNENPRSTSAFVSTISSSLGAGAGSSGTVLQLPGCRKPSDSRFFNSISVVVQGHHFPLASESRFRAFDFLAASSVCCSDWPAPEVFSGCAEVPSVSLPESFEGSSLMGTKGGGAEEIGVAMIGSELGGGVVEDI
jgi:hypothetical protein